MADDEPKSDPFLEDLDRRIAADNPHDSNGILSSIIRYELERQRLMDQRSEYIRQQVAYELAMRQVAHMRDYHDPI